MLTYDMTQRGTTPIYDYLYQCIREDIIYGRLQSRDKLPSKRTLAEHLKISLITVTNAYEQLEMEGYIRAVERKGYYVEDLSNYVVKETQPDPAMNQDYEEQEPSYYADFNANRVKTNMFPYATWSKLMREVFSEQQEKLLDTVPYNGIYELRLAIAQYLKKNRGMDVLPCQVIIGAGVEYLYNRLLMLFGRDYIFGMEEPGYTKIVKISEGYGIRWDYIPVDQCGIDVDTLEDSGVDIVHVSPANHYPTGTIMSIKRRIELFEWVNRIKKRYIIEDDYDSEFMDNGKMILPLYSTDTRNKVIYLNTFSKTLVPSLRIGYMILPIHLIEKYKKTLSFYSCTVSSFEQYTLARFISEGYYERHLNRLRKYFTTLRSDFISEIHQSGLNSIAEIIERLSGTYFCLKVRTDLTMEDIIAKAEQQRIRLNFYKEADLYEAGTCILIINYANLLPDEVSETVHRLCQIFL